ncbi:hypothetical protein [Streptomyces sp. JJ36]|uniref:hypothetical protein n=1 Tax=Streptomyces sp. JJ36 TaxID=2736645 RepID=UPI001F3F9FE9|nr:hypothetical protein [Streptomyces sp. JJ36]MCF6521533.1 hypothetical protein [Streptomyces sp. JJ36]
MSVTPPLGSGPDDGESSVPDEEWERFQREAEDSVRTSAAPREPSARARMVAARLRERDEEAARGQRGRRWGRKKEPEPWQPEGWRTWSAQETPGRRKWSTWLIGVAALALFAVWGSTQVYGMPDWLGTADASEKPLAAETAAPSSAPPQEAYPDRPTLDEPFAGSPARRWAEGAAAIELPEARAVGDVSAAEVEAGLMRAKEFLVAANLDPRVLAGGRPAEALSLVDPLQTGYLAELRSWVRNPSVENDPKWVFTRFDPDEVRLVGDTVKVRGRMTVEEGKQGKAEIHADYTFVYPLTKAQEAGEVTRTIVRRSLVAEVVDREKWEATEGKLWIAGHVGDIANDACAVGDGFIHPSFATDLRDEERTGPTSDPYDRSRPIDTERQGECGTATRI